jgi:hypothetical protein
MMNCKGGSNSSRSRKKPFRSSTSFRQNGSARLRDSNMIMSSCQQIGLWGWSLAFSERKKIRKRIETQAYHNNDKELSIHRYEGEFLIANSRKI